MDIRNTLLTDAQLREEIARCEYCEEKPCKEGCPADCSPADFILAASVGEPSDFGRAAAEILLANPLGGVCGLLCPDRHCQAKCSRGKLDRPVEIPSIQATVVAKAKALGVLPALAPVPMPWNEARVAVVGAGPAGLGAAAALARKGYGVEVFERGDRPGGACLEVPEHRLPRDVLESDIEYLMSFGMIDIHFHSSVNDPVALLEKGYAGVVVTSGLTEPIRLGIRGEDSAIAGLPYLMNPAGQPLAGKRVAVIGGGATAVDVAVTARKNGAAHVEMFCLETLHEMPLTARERDEILGARVAVSGRVRLAAIRVEQGVVTGILLRKVDLPAGKAFHPAAVEDVLGTDTVRPDIDAVIIAIGARKGLARIEHDRVVCAGDFDLGPTTVVTAVAAGKNAAEILDATLRGSARPAFPDAKKSRIFLPGWNRTPVPLDVDFFGRRIPSPFLLSAAPPSDGYDQMRKAYEAGWAGGVMKTSFDGVPIHIPGEYMHAFDGRTYGNCDNVSGHPLERVCAEIGMLCREYPDRLTAASTGGPVTGNDEHDRAGWQSNTRRLQAAGAMAIEYSLSCPQGGDGTEGDIVSQNAALTAKIIGWVMEVSDPEIPKLFKLTAAVTSIAVILRAVRKVLDRFPGKKAGVTLANTFPTLMFRKRGKPEWEEGIVVGMSGQGVAPISFLTLASVSNLGVTVSGNGGPMDYKSAAHFLALGCRSVQFCTIVMKQGYGVVRDLHSGLSHLMQARGLPSVEALIGRALPQPVTGFMDLTPVKRVSQSNPDLCTSCGNCTRCPYLAVSLDAERRPHTDASRCIGCSICVQKCFAGALSMRDRTPEETAALTET
jgi:NADPH-dependent glutamate synthase beta subunit-like oxidoreductase/dihydroorotate dehydrogenase/Pyruvate/2-oxoacid:ferredoxin oxidoreductase delta subunit